MTTSCSSGRLLVVNGVPHTGDVPPVPAFLETFSGAYTTTRTQENASRVLFWGRHLRRLADSTRILAEFKPNFFGPKHSSSRVSTLCSAIQPLVHDSLRVGLGLALNERNRAGSRDELAITALVRGGEDESNGLDVYLHIGFYVPLVFGTGVHLAVAGRGRDIAAAKYSEWVRVRKGMEKMRPPLATELLLSNDGDRILEGSVTNFFVVCRKANAHMIQKKEYSFEVQTAPISDGVLPGVVRQLVIELCSSRGIPLREVAPSWSDCELWEEAFVTNSLRLLQHVDIIQVPTCWEELHLKTWKEVSWVEKRFEGAGRITTQIQGAILERARVDAYQINDIL